MMSTVIGAAIMAALLLQPVVLAGQTALARSPQTSQTAEAASSATEDLFDVGDLVRKLLHKELSPEQKAAAADPTRSMRAVAPVIGYKPSSGAMIGVAGNVASYRGDPATTPISSTVASATISSKRQVSVTARSAVYGANDRWGFDGDNRLQWTSQDTFGLGTTTTPD
ncbi:MAG: hypothetical protein ACM36C_10695, partial [Acidobacteriota bacterium]